MKLITTPEADALILSPMMEHGQFDFDNLPFPNMRASNQVLVFSEGYLVDASQWWTEYRNATGLHYAPGSGMCEAGTKAFIGHVGAHGVQPFRGVGKVDEEVVAAARAQGRECPIEKLGDFSPGLYEIRCRIPGGVSLNGVTDGGHSTVAILIHHADGEIVAMLWEWQNARWERLDRAVARGVVITDAID